MILTTFAYIFFMTSSLILRLESSMNFQGFCLTVGLAGSVGNRCKMMSVRSLGVSSYGQANTMMYYWSISTNSFFYSASRWMLTQVSFMSSSFSRLITAISSRLGFLCLSNCSISCLVIFFVVWIILLEGFVTWNNRGMWFLINLITEKKIQV